MGRGWVTGILVVFSGVGLWTSPAVAGLAPGAILEKGEAPRPLASWTCHVERIQKDEASATPRREGQTQTRYDVRGSCLPAGGQQISWGGWGSYSPSTGQTEEHIYVPPASVRPQGEFSTRMVCPADPWETQQQVACQDVTALGEGSLANSPLSNLIQNQYRRPLSSVREFHAAGRPRVAETARFIGAAPRILSPTAGQSFTIGVSIPIKVAPPGDRTVNTYQLDLAKKIGDNCVSQSTIPNVPAAEAQAGYTGLGSSTHLLPTGGWCVRAQTTDPVVSAWSDWVGFAVTPVPTTTHSTQGPFRPLQRGEKKEEKIR